MIKGAKTIAQYCIFKWLDANFYTQALTITCISGDVVKITDTNKESAYIKYNNGKVYIEYEE